MLEQWPFGTVTLDQSLLPFQTGQILVVFPEQSIGSLFQKAIHCSSTQARQKNIGIYLFEGVTRASQVFDPEGKSIVTLRSLMLLLTNRQFDVTMVLRRPCAVDSIATLTLPNAFILNYAHQSM